MASEAHCQERATEVTTLKMDLAALKGPVAGEMLKTPPQRVNQ